MLQNFVSDYNALRITGSGGQGKGEGAERDGHPVQGQMPATEPPTSAKRT